MGVPVGFVCRFCGKVVKTTVPDVATKLQACQVLDKLLEWHLTEHVDDFLYGAGGVFSGPVRN